MNKSSLFAAAHQLTRKIMRAGDSYGATFALALRHLYHRPVATPVVVYITGDTYPVKDRLRKAGYRWIADRKAWAINYEEPVTPARAIDLVRQVPGIRNRGNFSASVQAAA